MNRHLKLNKVIPCIIAAFAVLNGCSHNEQKSNYVARVNNSYLTEEDLTAISGVNGGQKFFKEELIRNWINTELLYQQAKKEGITDSREFKRLMQNSAKELAAAMMIEKMYSENTPSVKPEDVKSYYEENKDIFRLNESAYIVNIAEFRDENKAVMFRSAAVESDWNKALNFFNNDLALNREESNKLYYSYDLQPRGLSRIAEGLNPGEVSLIIPADRNFMVIKLIGRLESGTIPPFDIIKDKVENRFIAVKRAEILKNYYRELYSANEIDVKQ